LNGEPAAENDDIDVSETGKCGLATTKARSMWCLGGAAKGAKPAAVGHAKWGGDTILGA
jgi:hypothetical protein